MHSLLKEEYCKKKSKFSGDNEFMLRAQDVDHGAHSNVPTCAVGRSAYRNRCWFLLVHEITIRRAPLPLPLDVLVQPKVHKFFT